MTDDELQKAMEAAEQVVKNGNRYSHLNHEYMLALALLELKKRILNIGEPA